MTLALTEPDPFRVLSENSTTNPTAHKITTEESQNCRSAALVNDNDCDVWVLIIFVGRMKGRPSAQVYAITPSHME